jgi:SAM-dependent methyltransferase
VNATLGRYAQTMTALVNKNCDICNANFDNSKLVAIENNFPIVKCRNCGFVYVNQQPKEEGGKVIGEYYQGDEVEAQYKRYNAVNIFLVTEINSAVKDKGRFLDVGCGFGSLLMGMLDSGWQAFGSELSQVAVDHVNKSVGKECSYYGLLPELPFEQHTFDVINMTNVLEHVPSPTQLMLECKDLLTPGGLLFVRVPNMDFTFLFKKVLGLFRLFGFEFSDFSLISTNPPIHLQGFDSRSLKTIFEKTGFETIEVKPSKLSNGKFYAVVEVLSKILYFGSLKTINLCPTVLAIARFKQTV